MDKKTNHAPSLTDRMRDYESASNYHITKRTPLIIRLTAKSLMDPEKNSNKLNLFDESFSKMMVSLVYKLQKSVPTCVFAFAIGSEVTLFLRDWDKLNTKAWHNGDLQKITSAVASIATYHFNNYSSSGAYPTIFESKAFVVPKDEVVNYFIYRQHDGLREAIHEVASSMFSEKELSNMRNSEVKDAVLDTDSWNALSIVFKHGVGFKEGESIVTTDMPLFKDDRQYIEDLIYNKGE